MYDAHSYALGCHATVDQVALSKAAARASEHKKAVREHRQELKAQRRRLRADRRTQQAYTTAV